MRDLDRTEFLTLTSVTEGAADRPQLPARQVPLRLVRNPRARRYILRLDADGAARVTVPRTGSLADARAFAARHAAWLVQQIERRARSPQVNHGWRDGDTVFLRGHPEVLRVMHPSSITGMAVQLGGEIIPVADATGDLRPAVQRHLWTLAGRELPPRTIALAATHGLTVRRVTVRNQRSRWGSCSPRGAISLNWRLVQMPDAARDYIILHELMHLRQPNHSPRFWREVARVCPDYREAEAWIRRHQAQLR